MADTCQYRNELKFLCGEREMYLVEDKIRHICALDMHVGENGKYLVKSLYFDTFDNRCYYENLSGVDDRKKYRIRIYNNDKSVIKLECKYSWHGRKAKESCEITELQCRQLMEGGHAAEMGMRSGQELLQRFTAEKRMELLAPKVIVEYTRTPYVFNAGNTRVTFDRAIRSSSNIRDFPDRMEPTRSVLPEGVHILEVKYDEVLPAAIAEMLAVGRNLRRTSFSKYALCRQHAII